VQPDFRDLLSTFNAHGVEYLIVGAHALAAHGHVRATKDLDVWLRPTQENAARALGALAEFGAPLGQLTAEDLRQPGSILQIGVPPLRIDVMTTIDGVEFEAAWPNRVRTRFAEEPALVISLADLIANKKATGRAQDLADVEHLERLRAGRGPGPSRGT
jgi:hypothetical protein